MLGRLRNRHFCRAACQLVALQIVVSNGKHACCSRSSPSKPDDRAIPRHAARAMPGCGTTPRLGKWGTDHRTARLPGRFTCCGFTAINRNVGRQHRICVDGSQRVVVYKSYAFFLAKGDLRYRVEGGGPEELCEASSATYQGLLDGLDLPE